MTVEKTADSFPEKDTRTIHDFIMKHENLITELEGAVRALDYAALGMLELHHESDARGFIYLSGKLVANVNKLKQALNYDTEVDKTA